MILIIYANIEIFYLINYNNFKVPDTLISGIVSKFKISLGFLPNTNSYGLKLSSLGVLKVLYTNVANGKYFGHI